MKIRVIEDESTKELYINRNDLLDWLGEYKEKQTLSLTRQTIKLLIDSLKKPEPKERRVP